MTSVSSKESLESEREELASPLPSLELEAMVWPKSKPSAPARIAHGIAEVSLKVFFSKVERANEENIPAEGPVILYGNHSNQFVDAMVMSHVAERPISFVMAAVSFKKAVIGDLARAMDAVPVTRPQDLVFWGKGSVDAIDLEKFTITGKGFKECLENGSLVSINGTWPQILITSVESDTSASFKKPPEELMEKLKAQPKVVIGEKYKVTPKVSHDTMFDAVYDHLRNGKCIGIFPEGGSHDRTQLLPLKAGVVMMALGALQRGIPVTVIPVGMNYFAGHHFRSRVFVDVGKPVMIEKRLVDMYAEEATRREATNILLERMTQALTFCVLRAPDFATLKAIRTARRMYQDKITLSAKEYIDLNLRFGRAFETLQDDPRLRELLNDVNDYLDFAKSQGLTDKHVRDLPRLGKVHNVIHGLGEMFQSLFTVLLLVPCIIPGLLLYLPIPLYTRKVVPAEMAKALAGSSVKIAARDVVASQKIMLAIKLIPLIHVIYSILWAVVFWYAWPLLDKGTFGPVGTYVAYHAWWILPILFNLLGPYYLFFFVPSSVESITRRIRLLPQHWKAFASFFSSTKRQPVELLQMDRKKLKVRIQDLAEEVLARFPDWDNDQRIINRAKLVKKRSDDTKEVAMKGELDNKLSFRQ